MFWRYPQHILVVFPASFAVLLEDTCNLFWRYRSILRYSRRVWRKPAAYFRGDCGVVNCFQKIWLTSHDRIVSYQLMTRTTREDICVAQSYSKQDATLACLNNTDNILLTIPKPFAFTMHTATTHISRNIQINITVQCHKSYFFLVEGLFLHAAWLEGARSVFVGYQWLFREFPACFRGTSGMLTEVVAAYFRGSLIVFSGYPQQSSVADSLISGVPRGSVCRKEGIGGSRSLPGTSCLLALCWTAWVRFESRE